MNENQQDLADKSQTPLTISSLACLTGKTVYVHVTQGDPNRPSLKFIRKHLKKQGAVSYN